MKEIASGIRYIGVDDLDLDLFESQYAVPEGMSYNSYLVIGDKVAIMDTVDARKADEWLRGLTEEGLIDYVAMDIKNSPERYGLTSGRPDPDLTPVYESIALLKEDKVDYEFRTTVVRQFHTVEDIRAAAVWIRGAKHYYLQNFVDSGMLLCPGLSGVSPEEMEKMADAARESVSEVALRGVQAPERS